MLCQTEQEIVIAVIRHLRKPLFAQLRQMTEEGAKRPDFLFDIPHIKRGAVVLTDAGRQALAQAE